MMSVPWCECSYSVPVMRGAPNESQKLWGSSTGNTNPWMTNSPPWAKTATLIAALVARAVRVVEHLCDVLQLPGRAPQVRRGDAQLAGEPLLVALVLVSEAIVLLEHGPHRARCAG